jgi:hypothetical protein
VLRRSYETASLGRFAPQDQASGPALAIRMSDAGGAIASRL